MFLSKLSNNFSRAKPLTFVKFKYLDKPTVQYAIMLMQMLSTAIMLFSVIAYIAMVTATLHCQYKHKFLSLETTYNSSILYTYDSSILYRDVSIITNQTTLRYKQVIHTL